MPIGANAQRVTYISVTREPMNGFALTGRPFVSIGALSHSIDGSALHVRVHRLSTKRKPYDLLSPSLGVNGIAKLLKKTQQPVLT